jgi:zinc transport system ATP-binding protein
MTIQANAANKPVIRVSSLTAGYDGKAVVSDLSFQVNKGDFLCIIGENGTGKSTVLKVMLKLLQPITGELEIIANNNNHNGNSSIGYLPQKTEAQRDFPASVRELVLSGTLNRRALFSFYSRADRQLADESMHWFGIASHAKQSYRELSGGQQQRVLLARALVARQDIIMLDEPTAGLDPRATTEMYELLSELHEQGLTIIMVTHDIAASVSCCSHVLQLGNQQQLFFGTSAEFLATEAQAIMSNSPQATRSSSEQQASSKPADTSNLSRKTHADA